MRFRDRNTGNLVTFDEVRLKFSNTSFPIVWNDEASNFAGVDPIDESPKPLDTEYKTFVEKGATQVNDKWVLAWKEVDKFTPDELNQYEKNKLEHKWNLIRSNRNNLLDKIDKDLIKHKELLELGNEPFSVDGVYSDSLYKDLLKYKQQLRDMTKNVNNVDNIIWPNDPRENVDNYKKTYVPKGAVQLPKNVSDINKS